ncbi:MAG: hypothetical protein NZM11_13305, partial [Anaerolineales bacterium]|nr:hypothetical protein [Anaerolineales bacterium]
MLNEVEAAVEGLALFLTTVTCTQPDSMHAKHVNRTLTLRLRSDERAQGSGGHPRKKKESYVVLLWRYTLFSFAGVRPRLMMPERSRRGGTFPDNLCMHITDKLRRLEPQNAVQLGQIDRDNVR